MKTAGILIPDVNGLFESTLKLILDKGEEDSFEQLSEIDKHNFIEAFEEEWISYFQVKASEIYPSYMESNFKNQITISDINNESFKHFCGYNKLSYDLFNSLAGKLDSFGLHLSNKIIISKYGELIRISDQIFTMISNGYPDGALRLWRILHEQSVILMLFIKEYNNKEIFERFIDYEHLSKSRKIESYTNHHETLKFPELDTDLIADSKAKIDLYKQKYGKNFFDEFGWAYVASGVGKKVSFREIEEIVGCSKLRPYYIWASSYIHPSFESLHDYRSSTNTINLHKITEQTIDKQSVIDPLQLTLRSHHDVHLKILNLYCLDYEYDINVGLFTKVFKMMQNALNTN